MKWLGVFMVPEVVATQGLMPRFRSSYVALHVSQKTSKGVSFYSKLVNRPAGRVLAAAAFALGLSPNAVTVLSGVSTGIGLVLLVVSTPSIAIGVAVWLCLALGFALDSADGQVARLSGRSSVVGEWFDHTLDAAKMVLVHTAVLVAWYRFLDLSDAWLLVPLGFQLVSVVTYSGGTLVGLLKRTVARGVSDPVPADGAKPEGASAVRAALLLPGDFGILCLSFVLWGAGDAFRDVYLVLFVLNCGLLGALLMKWSRELSRVHNA
jgi:phosphatidylglycerophosphate synthase